MPGASSAAAAAALALVSGSAVGSALASASSCLSVAALGRFASVTRAVSVLFGGRSDEQHDELASSRNLAFVSGALLGPFAVPVSAVDAFGSVGLAAYDTAAAAASLHPSAPALVLAGFLTGAGAQMAGGGIFAHALSSLPARVHTKRSALAATIMASTAIATANAVQFVPRLQEMSFLESSLSRHSLDAIIVADGPSMVAFLGAGLGFIAWRRRRKLRPASPKALTLKAIGASWASGAGLSAGISLIGLANPDKVLQTLAPLAHGTLDPSLILGTAAFAALNALGFSRILARNKPLLAQRFHIDNREQIGRVRAEANDTEDGVKQGSEDGVAASTIQWMDETSKRLPSMTSLVVGSSMFGLGFGLAGLTPLGGIAGLSSGSASFCVWSGSMLSGIGLVNWAQTRESFRKQQS